MISRRTFLKTAALNTDPYFVECVISGMKPLGFSPGKFFIREVNSKTWDDHVYMKMSNRAGVDLRAINGRAPGIQIDKMSGWARNEDIISEHDMHGLNLLTTAAKHAKCL